MSSLYGYDGSNFFVNTILMGVMAYIGAIAWRITGGVIEERLANLFRRFLLHEHKIVVYQRETPGTYRVLRDWMTAKMNESGFASVDYATRLARDIVMPDTNAVQSKHKYRPESNGKVEFMWEGVPFRLSSTSHTHFSHYIHTVTTHQIEIRWNAANPDIGGRFIEHVCKDHVMDAKRLFKIHVGIDSCNIVHAKRDIDTVFHEPSLLTSIIDDLRNFIESRRYYEQRGLVHKRGYIFQGPPGGGKTTMVNYLASRFDLPMFIYSTGSDGFRSTTIDAFLRNAHSVANEEKGPNGGQCYITLFEDVDHIFFLDEKEDDTNTNTFQPKNNMHTVLNALDGFLTSCPGRIVIFTSNNPEKLPEKLMRPGRIDRKFDFGPASSETLQSLYLHMMAEEDKWPKMNLETQSWDFPSTIDDDDDLILARKFASQNEGAMIAAAQCKLFIQRFQAPEDRASLSASSH